MIIKISGEELNYIQIFEYITDTDCLDCFLHKETNVVYFVVEQGKLGKAVGKDGANANLIKSKIGKEIRIIEFSPNVENFVKNVIPNVNSVEVKNENDGIILNVKVDKHARPFVLGRDGRNLKIYYRLISKQFKIKEINIK